MDIEYLLFLQRFRESINDSLTPFMEGISLFAVTYLIMIPVFVYWVVSKRKGLYTLVSYYLCCGFNAIVKLTVCAYRPWIRDARVHPAILSPAATPSRQGRSTGAWPWCPGPGRNSSP